MSTPLPTLYLSHGSPMIALEPGEAGRFMQRLGPVIDRLWGRPRAVVIMSPHTASATPQVLGAERFSTVHDFGGFPPALYEVRYDAPGDLALASQVAEMLKQQDARTVLTAQSGLDHGIWTVLMHLYPHADVPVIPVALAPVDAPEEPDCAAFRAWVAERAHGGVEQDWQALLDYRAQAPHALAMHPADDHWLPFYFAAGAAGDAAPGAVDDATHSGVGPMPTAALRLHASVTHGHLAMDAYGFGEADQLAHCAKALSS
jgi:4,5-DOPA dioxygenase extradiol